MKKEEILTQLREITSNKDLDFPKELGIESNDGVLSLTMTSQGLVNNMQDNPAAFEGWAIAIKSIAPDLAKKVVIKWRGMGLKQGTEYNHYRRFLYRVIRFKESYDWAENRPLDTEAKNDLNLISSEISDWVVNYPVTESQDEAETTEALLERKIISELPGIHNHQLPVGMFHKTKSKETRRTPGGKAQIDLWSLDGDELCLYELKTDVNNPAGIISELMFYTNVMQDLVSGTIKYAFGADKVILRSFDKLYTAICSKQISKVSGVFLTNNLHSMLQINLQKLFDILNENTRNIHYEKIGFNIQSQSVIIK